MSQTAPTVPLPGLDAPLSPFGAIVGTFLRPSGTFERLVRRPTWWLPFVLSVAATSAILLVSTPKIDLAPTVKGIIANLLDNYGISVEVDGNNHYLTRGNFGYKAQVKKLPSGLVHGVVFLKLALPKSEEEGQDTLFILADNRDEVLTLFFRHLDEKTDILLHPYGPCGSGRLLRVRRDGCLKPSPS